MILLTHSLAQAGYTYELNFELQPQSFLQLPITAWFQGLSGPMYMTRQPQVWVRLDQWYFFHFMFGN